LADPGPAIGLLVLCGRSLKKWMGAIVKE